MRILIAAVSAASELSGVQRHAFNVASCLLSLPEIASVDLIIAPWQAHMTAAHAPAEAGRLQVHVEEIRNTVVARNIWFYNRLPSLARSLNVDLVHVCYPVPLQREAFHCPVVVTLHDFYPYEAPRNFGWIKAWLNRRVLQQCLRNADRVACVSDATIAALKMHAAPCIWRKVSRVYNSVGLAGVGSHQPEGLLPAAVPFLLCVAQHRHNKNIGLALRSFHLLLRRRAIDAKTRFLLVGIPGPETPHIQRLIEELGLRGLVILTEGLPDEALLWCYQHCAALVMPSFTEGFGLPAVEAQLAGCAVICSDIPVLREVGGDRCTFVPLVGNAVAAFANALSESLNRPRPEPVLLPQFCTAQIAREYFALYHEMLTTAETLSVPRAVTSLSNSTVSERQIP